LWFESPQLRREVAANHPWLPNRTPVISTCLPEDGAKVQIRSDATALAT